MITTFVSDFEFAVTLSMCLLILIHRLSILIGAGKSNTARTIIAIVVPVACVVLLLALLCVYLSLRKQRKKNKCKSNLDLPSLL